MAFRQRARTLFEWLGPADDRRILDCGCGRGFYLAMVTAYAAAAIPAAVIVWRSETNGDDGLLVPSLRYTGNALHVMTQRDAFRLIVVVTLLSAYFVSNTARSSWGRWFRCLAVSSVGKRSGQALS